MCGIVGIVSQRAVNQNIYDALTVLQHRGQDAAGAVTFDGTYSYAVSAGPLYGGKRPLVSDDATAADTAPVPPPTTTTSTS